MRGQDGPEDEEEEDSEEQQIPHLVASKVCIDWLHQQSEGEPSQIFASTKVTAQTNHKN